jgi:hypothetical protein
MPNALGRWSRSTRRRHNCASANHDAFPPGRCFAALRISENPAQPLANAVQDLGVARIVRRQDGAEWDRHFVHAIDGSGQVDAVDGRGETDGGRNRRGDGRVVQRNRRNAAGPRRRCPAADRWAVRGATPRARRTDRKAGGWLIHVYYHPLPCGDRCPRLSAVAPRRADGVFERRPRCHRLGVLSG